MRFMRFLYSHYTKSSLTSLTDSSLASPILPTLYKIYFTLMLSASMCTLGGVLNIVLPLGTTLSGSSFLLTIWWLYSNESEKQLRMFLTVLASSLFLGATAASLMHTFSSLEERDIIIFFGGFALLFCFHLFALRTHNIQVIFQINYFTLPLFILSVFISRYFVSHGIFPDDLVYVIPFVVAVPFSWHLGLWCFRDKIWTWGAWIPIHLYLLTVLSFFTHHRVLYLLGIYLFMLCILENLKLHTIDSIYLVARSYERAPLPVSLSLTFFTEFLGRLSYMFIYSGKTLYEHLWETNHIVLGQIWQTCSAFCAKVFDFCLLLLWKSFDYIMTIFMKVWDSACSYYGQFKDIMVELMFALAVLTIFSIIMFLYFLFTRG